MEVSVDENLTLNLRHAVDNFRQDGGPETQHEEAVVGVDLDPFIRAGPALSKKDSGRRTNKLADFVQIVFTDDDDHPADSRDGSQTQRS